MSEFKEQDALDAGWVIVHEGVEEEVEGSTLNASHWRAEKYLNVEGRAGEFVEAAAPTKERLIEAIATREQQFAPSQEGTVLLPNPDAEEVSTSDPETFERVSDAEFSDASNDTLTVLSDPSDPDSEPVQKVISGGQEVPIEDAEVTHESLSEPTIGDGTAAETDQANADAIVKAKELRDSGDTEDEDAKPSEAQAAIADARLGDQGDSGNAETVQPAAGEATDASDSEQQEAVPDSEAAESDEAQTNAGDPFPKDNASQDEITGQSSDAVEPLRPENAGQGDVPAGTGQPIDPEFKQNTEVTGPDAA